MPSEIRLSRKEFCEWLRRLRPDLERCYRRQWEFEPDFLPVLTDTDYLAFWVQDPQSFYTPHIIPIAYNTKTGAVYSLRMGSDINSFYQALHNLKGVSSNEPLHSLPN